MMPPHSRYLRCCCPFPTPFDSSNLGFERKIEKKQLNFIVAKNATLVVKKSVYGTARVRVTYSKFGGARHTLTPSFAGTSII